MIRLHRECGETSLPVEDFVRFHHLCCVVPLPAGVIGACLAGWAKAGTRFGPLKATLAGAASPIEVTATLEALEIGTKNTVYRLELILST